MEFEIIEKEIGNALEIEERIPMWKMPMVISKNYERITVYLESHDAECVEAPYTRYLDVDWDAQTSKGFLANLIDAFTKKWHLQIGMPVSKKLDGEEDLKPIVFKKRKYVKGMHYGPYQKVGATYKKMYKWIVSQGLIVEGESIEFYMNDPHVTKKEDLETIIYVPIVE